MNKALELLGVITNKFAELDEQNRQEVLKILSMKEGEITSITTPEGPHNITKFKDDIYIIAFDPYVPIKVVFSGPSPYDAEQDIQMRKPMGGLSLVLPTNHYWRYKHLFR